MDWSKEQVQKHEENFEQFREAYIHIKNKFAPISTIKADKRRCVTLVEMLENHSQISKGISALNSQLGNESGLYFHEIPHFTIDCHRYLNPNELPEDIEKMSLIEQQKAVITPEEFSAYNRILNEEIKKEKAFNYEVKGVAFGGDGLIAQVWYDNVRMQSFNDRLRERVRWEVPSMDFLWGIVKNKVPIRIVNLSRFTGQEDRQKVISFIDANKNVKIGNASVDIASLVFSDHYIQERNTSNLNTYLFR